MLEQQLSGCDKLPNYSEIKGLSDSEFRIVLWDKLMSLANGQDAIKTNQCNHLKHHWAITLICVTAGLTGIFNLGIAFVIVFVKGI